jgi:predicted lactoylglutathione lyase
MDQRISFITLGVRDLGKSVEFYKAMGWDPATDNGSIVAFNILGMALALYQIDRLSEDVGFHIGSADHPQFTLAYNTESVEDVDKLLQEAELAGGRLVKTATKAFWGGYSGYFSDPDGFLWEIAYNPELPLGPNGEFQWT